MSDSKVLSAGRAMPSRWSFEAEDVRPVPNVWRLERWFPRKQPSLFQRCLAVHILAASEHSSLH
jgi:hypothetical protein